MGAEFSKDLGKMGDGFNEMGNKFSKMEGLFEALDFKAADDN